MLLASAILWQIKVPALYEEYAVQAGRGLPGLGFVARDEAFLLLS